MLSWFFFTLGNIFQWTFRNLLVPIGGTADWIIFIIVCLFFVWWCFKIITFGKDDKTYKGW